MTSSVAGNGATLERVRAGLVARLRARRQEIERAVFARVREVVPDPVGNGDAEYVEGLRAAVAAAVGYGIAGLERTDAGFPTIPDEAVAQAQRAARSGVGLEAVLRRYIVGNALLWDYVMQEADLLERAGRGSGLREMSRTQAVLLDRLVIGVTREHVAELQRASRSREHRLLERVRVLLAGEYPEEDAALGVSKLDYDLDGEHLGLIARGAGAQDAVRELAARLGRRLLSVAYREETVWAWLGGSQPVDVGELERAVYSGVLGGGVGDGVGGVAFATGEPARGFGGWRISHRQAQAALTVAERRPRALTRYGDVALLATALKDEPLARALIDLYLAPLQDSGGGDSVLLRTLHAYVAAECNASSAAVVLQVARSTVLGRLRTVEERLGRTLHPCPTELEVALELDALAAPKPPGNATRRTDFT